MTSEKITKTTRADDPDWGDFEVKHYADGSVMISQTGGFDGRERVFIPASVYAAFMAAMERPK